MQLGVCVQLADGEMLPVIGAVLLSGDARRERAGVLCELSVYRRLREFVYALLAQGEGRADEEPQWCVLRVKWRAASECGEAVTRP